MNRRRLNCITLLACSLLAPTFAGQRDQQRFPRYKAAVNLVMIDAVVTDRKGAYPGDLRREDFEVYEDGVRQTIQDFRRVHVGSIAATQTAPAKLPGPQPPVSEPEPPRLFLLMIDNLSSQWTNLYQVSEALEKLVAENLLPQDLVAVATASHTGGLVQTFTNDRQALLQAIRNALGLSLQGTMAEGAKSRAIREAEQAPPLAESACLYTGLPESMQIDTAAWENAARVFAVQNDYSARGCLYTLQSACKALGVLKGRKTVIMISEGFGISDPVQAALPKVIDAANKANVAIYTINPRGLEQSDLSRPVSLTQAPQATTFQSAGMVVAGNSAFDLIRMENRANLREDCLGELATGTGGVILRNTNEFQRGLERALNDGHFYYELTYLPKNQNLNGNFRKIEVRLNPGLHGYAVRTRRGYYAVDSIAAMAGSAEAQLSQALYDTNLLDDLDTTVASADFADPQGGNFARIYLTLLPSHITLRKEGDRQTAEFKFLAAVFDERGTLVSDYTRDCRLSLNESTLPGFMRDGATLAMNFKLTPGRYQVKTVVREISTGRMGARRGDLKITPFDTGGPQISTIVLGQQQTIVSHEPGGQGTRKEYEPLTVSNAVLVASPANSFSREGFLTALFHVYNVSDPQDPRETQYCYQMSLYRDDELLTRSEPKSVRSEIQHPLSGFVVTTKLSLSTLPPGNYSLKVDVALPDGGDLVSRSVPFQVR